MNSKTVWRALGVLAGVYVLGGVAVWLLAEHNLDFKNSLAARGFAAPAASGADPIFTLGSQPAVYVTWLTLLSWLGVAAIIAGVVGVVAALLDREEPDIDYAPVQHMQPQQPQQPQQMQPMQPMQPGMPQQMMPQMPPVGGPQGYPPNPGGG